MKGREETKRRIDGKIKRMRRGEGNREETVRRGESKERRVKRGESEREERQ